MTEIPRITQREGEWAVVRLPPGAPVPPWADGGGFSSVTRTAQELSIVCRESGIPSGVEREGGWSLLELAGPIPFTAVGVLASVLAPLARAGVSVFVMSTFDTDYVLVKRERVRAALDAIASAARERSRQGEDRGVD